MFFDYKKIIGKLNSLAIIWHDNDSNIEKEDLYEVIHNHIFEYVYFLIFDKTANADIALDFFLENISNKIKLILDTYDKSKGEFVSFLNAFCYNSFQRFKINMARIEFIKNSSNYIIKQLMKNSMLENECFESFYDDSDQDDYNQDNQYVVKDLNSSYNYNDNSKQATTCDLSSFDFKSLKSKNLCILVYTLRCANEIDDKKVNKIAKFIGIDPSILLHLIEKAKESLEDRYEKILSHLEKSGEYIIKISTLRYKNYCSDPETVKKNNEKIEKYQALYDNHVKKTQNLTVVSESIIAELLNLEHDKIRYLMHRGKKILLKMKEELNGFDV